MNVGIKLALGGSLAVLPLVGGLAYTVTQVDALARQNALTTQRQYRAAQIALKVLRGLELTSEYRRKLNITKDEGYRAKLSESEAQLAALVDELNATELTAAEQAATVSLSNALRATNNRSAAMKAATSGAASATSSSDARAAGNALLDASRQALNDHARWAQERSRATAKIAAVVGTLAVLMSAIVIWLLVRSLQPPLRQLIRGTRAVAGGDFEYRAKPMANDELGEVTRAFNQMVDSLGELERLKAEFVSRVSHELRTPLVAMIETNRLLLDEIPGPLLASQRTMLELHDGAAERLSAMIGDLLDLSTLEANDSLEIAQVDLVALTRAVVDQLEPLARERSIQLDRGFSALTSVARCDPRRYQQVVQNLVDNALKHSPAGGVVHVGLAICGGDALPNPVAEEADKSFALLRVEDEGPGVEPRDRERIFHKFVQAAGVRPGVGLGLAICRQIALAHGGRVGVDDSALGGAYFYAAFPLAEEERS